MVPGNTIDFTGSQKCKARILASFHVRKIVRANAVKLAQTA